jgi:sulfite reductase alpha subunit-like flavoprotein
VIKSIKWTDGTPATPPPLPHLHRGHSLHHNLLWTADLTTPPSKAVLVALAACTPDAAQAATLTYLGSREGRAAYKRDVAKGRPTLLQLLQRYDKCAPPVGRLLELLGPLRPRQYSLANAADGSGGEALECAWKVVEYATHWGSHGGVATTWLEREGQHRSDSSKARRTVQCIVCFSSAHRCMASVICDRSSILQTSACCTAKACTRAATRTAASCVVPTIAD